MPLSKDFREFIGLLNSNRVESKLVKRRSYANCILRGWANQEVNVSSKTRHAMKR